MDKPKRVSQFMQHFFGGALPQQALLGGKSIKLLMQPAKRNHSDRTVKLRLPEQETQHRDREVHIGYAKHPGGIARSVLGQHFHDLYRLVLASLRVICTFRNR